jgi:YihY family inner membrane protein
VRSVQVGLEVFDKSALDDVGTQASALTFAMFLSVLPILLLGLWVTGRVVDVGSDWLAEVLAAVPGLAELTSSEARRLLRADLGLGLVAAGGVLWAASGLSSRAQGALGRIFARPPVALTGRISAIAATLVLLALLIGSAIASAALGNLTMPGIPSGPASLIGRLMLLPGELAYILVAYWLLTPGRAVRIREHLAGAILFTLGWSVLKIVGTVLVERTIARASALYGTIGTVFGLLVFLRVVASLFLYGAELSSVLRRDSAR